jgi:hypothetical protein
LAWDCPAFASRRLNLTKATGVPTLAFKFIMLKLNKNVLRREKWSRWAGRCE